MTRKKTLNGKDGNLPNSLVNGKKAPFEDTTLTNSISKVKEHLRENFFDPDLVAVAAVLDEIRKSPEPSLLVKELLSDSGSSWGVSSALMKAAENGMDISFAIPPLVKQLSNPFPIVRDNATMALEHVAARGTPEIRSFLTNEIISFVHSEWFVAEAEKNSPAFGYSTLAVVRVLERMKEAVREAA